MKRNIWSLPACQSIFLTDKGPVVMQGKPLVSGSADIPSFDRGALTRALRIDQAGESTFPESSPPRGSPASFDTTWTSQDGQ